MELAELLLDDCQSERNPDATTRMDREARCRVSRSYVPLGQSGSSAFSQGNTTETTEVRFLTQRARDRSRPLEFRDSAREFLNLGVSSP